MATSTAASQHRVVPTRTPPVKAEHAESSSSSCMKKRTWMLRSIFMFPDRSDVVLMLLGILGSIGDGMTLPFILFNFAGFINNIASANTAVEAFSTHRVKEIALVLCYIACGQFVTCFLEGYCWRRTSERQASRLRVKYLKAVMRQDVGYFDVNVSTTAEVIASVSSNTLLIQDVISEKVPVFLTKLSTFVAGYIFAFLLNWKLAIVSFPFLLFLVIPGLIYGRTLMGIGRKQRDEYRKADTIVEQAISSIRTVYSFVGETQTITGYSEALQSPLKLGLRQGFIKGLAIGSSGINFAIWAFMTYYSGRLVMYHGVQGGNVYSAVSAVIIGGAAFGASLANIKYFSEASAAGERIMEVIERVPEIDSDNVEGQVPADVLGEVEFKHIEFAYPSRLNSIIFEDFSMIIPAGKTVALVGGSGSGKSTVFSLLQRFYNPLSGEILLDGLSVDKLQLKWLRSQMGLVSQEPALFAMTIKENILFGKEDASMEEVIEASKASNAHNFITQLPNGYNTKVGERGIQLSGGQKQRIAVARAIIKSPKILLLDEATSALDSESERLVQEALDQAAIGRTNIVVAHRLSTIRNADIITVLQNGQIKETGSHDQLMAEDGVYASLVRIQKNDNIVNSADTDEVMVSSYDSKYNDARGSSCRSLSDMSCDDSASSVAPPTNGMELATVTSEQVSPTPSFRRLLAKNSPEWKQATLGCTSAVLFGAIQPAYAYALGSLISVFFLPDHHEIKRQIEIYSLCFLGLAMLSLLINVSQHYYFAVMGENLTKRIREELLSKLLTFEIGWFDRDESSTGAICSTLARDAGALRSLVGDRMGLLIQTFSSTTIAFGLSLIIAWRLALAMISVQPLVILCYYCKKVVIQSVSHKAIKAQEESSKIAAEAVSNLRTITAFSSQDRIIQLLKESQESPKRESVRQSWFSGSLLGASQSLGTLGWAFTFWYGGKLIAEGDLGTKGFMQTFLILVTSGIVIAEAGSMTSDIASSGSAVQSVFAVLDRLSMMEPEDPKGHKPIKLTGNIELRDVDFAYPTRPGVMIFQEFSIDIEAGKSTALVGQSGSGKSTIIGLIERFYDPINGTVKIDGRDIKSYHLRSLRMHIALVSQEPTLFAGTIRQNITYGAREGITETELIRAAKAANAHDFIAGLKDGYDTSCGDRGVQLSGGQKQRIAIARAILKDPAILLLDEATSALDSHSEKVVQDALEQVIVGRTSVVVAHRLSTVRNCDMIAVLEQGKVVEKGTHSSLLAKGPTGAYSSLVCLQTSSEI